MYTVECHSKLAIGFGILFEQIPSNNKTRTLRENRRIIKSSISHYPTQQAMLVTLCVNVLKDAKKAIKYLLSDEQIETITSAYNEHPVVVFVDLDNARSRNENGIRNELLEVAYLFRRAGGMIYGLTSFNIVEGRNSAFVQVYGGPGFADKHKAYQIKNDTLKLCGYRVFAFGSRKMIDKLTKEWRPGDLFFQTEDAHQLQSYTLVEYILIYLTMKLEMNSINA